MAEPKAILFDFFGTLVDYSPSRTQQGYSKSLKLIATMGGDLEYQQFLTEWSDESARFDKRSEIDNSEYSMEEVSNAFLTRILGRQPSSIQIAELANSYLDEWNTGVVYPTHTRKIVEHFANRFRLAVVTNAHQFDLVANHLDAMGIADYFETVVTSVEVGWRKPHPAIYIETMNRLGVSAREAMFVGDNCTADYAGPRAEGRRHFS